MKIPDRNTHNDLNIFHEYLSGKKTEPEMIFFCLKRAKTLMESLDDNPSGWDDAEAVEIDSILKSMDFFQKESQKSPVRILLPADHKERVDMFLFKLNEGIQKDNAEQTLVWYIGIAKYFISVLETDNKKTWIQELYQLADELAKRCENFLIDVDIEKLQ